MEPPGFDDPDVHQDLHDAKQAVHVDALAPGRHRAGKLRVGRVTEIAHRTREAVHRMLVMKPSTGEPLTMPPLYVPHSDVQIWLG